MARSGFLSLVGMSHNPQGINKTIVSLPQQPTNTLMFYYVHSMMAVTKVLLNLGKPQVIQNVAEDNLVYLC